VTHIGFTGTQAGMTDAQQSSAYQIVALSEATDLHHGDAIGADDQMDQIARELGLLRHIHIPTNGSKRARCMPRLGIDLVYAPLPYLERNRAIVDASEAMIATPKEMAETLRSGTWATVRYTRKQGKPLFIVWPDGTVSEERTPPRTD
jgi:hypothetical protein